MKSIAERFVSLNKLFVKSVYVKLASQKLPSLKSTSCALHSSITISFRLSPKKVESLIIHLKNFIGENNAIFGQVAFVQSTPITLQSSNTTSLNLQWFILATLRLHWVKWHSINLQSMKIVSLKSQPLKEHSSNDVELIFLPDNFSLLKFVTIQY